MSSSPMPLASPEPPLVYDRVQMEARFDSSPALMAKIAIDHEMAGLSGDNYHFYAVRNLVGSAKEIFPLKELSGTQLARQISLAPDALRVNLAALADRVRQVLDHSDDPIALEHQAVLFWPELNSLHDYLGLDLRADELITALDITRSQFRLKPVSVSCLRALEKVIRESAQTTPFTAALVDAWVGALEDAGADVSHPLSFESSHAD